LFFQSFVTTKDCLWFGILKFTFSMEREEGSCSIVQLFIIKILYKDLVIVLLTYVVNIPQLIELSNHSLGGYLPY